MIQNELQRYIFKIHSAKLRKAKWNLTLPINEARKNNEVISLAGSQMLRWIDELNGCVDCDAKAHIVRNEIKQIKKEPNSAQNKRRIRLLYQQLDALQFKPDYINIIIDSKTDYRRLCKGFFVNGIKYKRLLGTSGGIKNSTIVFVSERLRDELNRRINNDRNPEILFNPAKLEAYRALTCSASVPVSMPKKILVVNDCETHFLADIIYLENGEGDDEPKETFKKDEPITLNASDGFGMMSPELASRWSGDLELNYLVAGVNTRFAYTKGMVFTFDFHRFAHEVAKTNIVKDVWGNEVNIDEVDLVLTTSMVKLWSSYESCDDFVNKSIKNGYSFGITKTTPKILESERSLNYQFIQSFYLTETDIDELIGTSMREIEDVLGGDWRSTALFLLGKGINEERISCLENNYIKGILINHDLLNDDYIRSCVYRQIKNTIKEAKTGVIKVHGNYSIVSGDPYSLCQSIFGLEITGLLNVGEIYNKYWVDNGVDDVIGFRAPMTAHNNIRRLSISKSEATKQWYTYMNTVTILNSWDTCCAAFNGMDFDGDLLMLTDNPVLKRTHRELPAILCSQKTAAKTIPTERDYIESNLASFGNDIGKITNKITSMYEIQSHFDKDSVEYSELEYRIRCGQLHQQDTIDKIKGIIAKPMQKSWYDRKAANNLEEKREFYLSILADKKPYFMKYIYPRLSHRYQDYIRAANRNSLREFGLTIDELLVTPSADLTEAEKTFVDFYNIFLPVGDGGCVMNVICHKFEKAFDKHANRCKNGGVFNPDCLKSDTEYTTKQYYEIKRLYSEYNKQLQSYKLFTELENINDDDSSLSLNYLKRSFKAECEQVCPNAKALCNILVDIAYSKTVTRKFAWDMCGETIIDNLLQNSKGWIEYPIPKRDGDLVYCNLTYGTKGFYLEGVM